MVVMLRLVSQDRELNPLEITVKGGRSTGVVRVGRERERVDVVITSVLDATAISRCHAELREFTSEGVWITDLSFNGMLLNFKPVRSASGTSCPKGSAFLARTGDKITFGTNAAELTYLVVKTAGAMLGRLVLRASYEGEDRAAAVVPPYSAQAATLSSIVNEEAADDVDEEARAVSWSAGNVLVAQHAAGCHRNITEEGFDNDYYVTAASKMAAYLSSAFSFESGGFGHTMPAGAFAASLLILAEGVERLQFGWGGVGANPWFVRLRSPLYVVGDLHGSFRDLLHFVNRLTPCGDVRFAPCPLVFLGDFVDRGPHSVEVVAFLFALKLLSNDNVVLVRGNHEDPLVNGDTSCPHSGCFLQQCEEFFDDAPAGTGGRIWEVVNKTFSALPVCADVDEDVFLCHGGVPRGLDVSELKEHPASFSRYVTVVPEDDTMLDPEERRKLLMVRDLLWSDPCPEHDGDAIGAPLFRPSERCPEEDPECVVSFTGKALEEFLRTNRYSMMLRAHQFQQDGVRVAKEGRLVTVFSSSDYCGASGRAGVVLVQPSEVKLLSFDGAPRSGGVCVEEAAVEVCGDEKGSTLSKDSFFNTSLLNGSDSQSAFDKSRGGNVPSVQRRQVLSDSFKGASPTQSSWFAGAVTTRSSKSTPTHTPQLCVRHPSCARP
eukprot:Rhum_TRINITY_DN21116_c0_g1::Rhum_TRINITY_DN21116_c0_g1_i1::g.173246::m.173246